MTRIQVALPATLMVALALTACSGGSNTTVSAPPPSTQSTVLPEAQMGTIQAGAALLGAMQVEINMEDLSFRTTPLIHRSAQDRGDVVDGIDLTYYFSSAVFCTAGDCISLKSIGLDNEGGTLPIPLVTATFAIKHPFSVATPPVTGTGRSRNDLSVHNVRGYIVNGGPNPASDIVDTGIPLVPAGIATGTGADTGTIKAYFGPRTGGPYPGLAGYVINAEGMNNGADGVLTTSAGAPVAEASLPLFDYTSPDGFGGVFASPYVEFIPSGDTGDRVLAQGQSAETTFKLNAAAGANTVSFIFALAGNYGNSAGPIASDPPSEKVVRTRERRGNPIYYRPGFNKPEALTMVKDTTNSSNGAAGTNTPVNLYVDITDMQAGAALPPSWSAWYNPASEAAVRNVLPPDLSVVTERAGFSTVFVLGTPTPSGGGLTGILRGESPSLKFYNAPTPGGVQHISWVVFDDATGNQVIGYSAGNDIAGTKILPTGVGLPPAGFAHGIGSDPDGATPASPLKVHIQIPTGTGAGELPAGSYTVVMVAYDDLIDDGDSVTNSLFEESAWNMQRFSITVDP